MEPAEGGSEHARACVTNSDLDHSWSHQITAGDSRLSAATPHTSSYSPDGIDPIISLWPEFQRIFLTEPLQLLGRERILPRTQRSDPSFVTLALRLEPWLHPQPTARL